MPTRQTLIALIAAPALALAVACGGNDDTDSSQAAPTATMPAQAAATQPSGQATQPSGQAGAAVNDLERMAQAFAQVRSFRAQVIIESGGTREEIKMEAVLPDRFRIEMAGFQAINIGDDLWLNIGGTWMQQPGLGGAIPLTPSEIQDSIDELLTNSAVTRRGTDTVGGVPCQIIVVSEGIAAEETEMCVAQNNLPLRFVYLGANDKTTILFTDFNANITINRPI